MSIKKPGGLRRTYAIVLKGQTVKDPRIDAVNKDFLKGAPPDEVEARLKAIRESLHPKKLILSYTNYRLLEDCHTYKLKTKPHLVDAYALKRGLIRAVEAVGTLAIKEASLEQLLSSIAHVKRPGRRYHVVRALNELLRFAKRDLRLPNRQARHLHIDYIEIEDFMKKVDNLPEDYATYLGALFATGARWGELPVAIIQGQSVTIASQIRKSGIEGPTKNRKVRSAPIIPSLKAYVVRLNALGRARVEELRIYHEARIYKATKKHLGLSAKALRHSYAIYCAKRGEGLPDIARWIGDTEEVCRRHYSSYLPSNPELEAVAKRWATSP